MVFRCVIKSLTLFLFILSLSLASHSPRFFSWRLKHQRTCSQTLVARAHTLNRRAKHFCNSARVTVFRNAIRPRAIGELCSKLFSFVLLARKRTQQKRTNRTGNCGIRFYAGRNFLPRKRRSLCRNCFSQLYRRY